jgi:hypothetical protein
MSGDLFELLFVIAFILIGLLGGRKKKPRADQPRPRRLPRERPMPRPAPPARPTAGRIAPSRTRMEPPTAQEALLRELEGLLTGRRPAPAETELMWAPPPSDRVPDPEEARSLETLESEEAAGWEEGLDRAPEEIRDTPRWAEGRDQQAASLETLEEAGEASHIRFHQKYAASAGPQPMGQRAPSFDLAEVRRALVWSEILGAPVSMR